MSIEPTFRKPVETVKGWGKEVEIANNEKYCGKLLCFNKGARFSMHYHLKKTESFYILKGSIRFIYYNLERANVLVKQLAEGDVIDIPIGCPHQIYALSDVIVVEVSTQHFDEDSFRIEKGDSQNKSPSPKEDEHS